MLWMGINEKQRAREQHLGQLFFLLLFPTIVHLYYSSTLPKRVSWLNDSKLESVSTLEFNGI